MLRRFFDFMAKMGLSVRDDPPKVVDLSVREFGETVSGLALSIRQIARDDPAALVSVSVVIRNVGQDMVSFVVPGWLAFYRFEVTSADGTPAPLTPFGRALANPERKQERLDASLPPGGLHETEAPLGSLFRLRPRESYTMRACCQPAGEDELRSNEIVLR